MKTRTKIICTIGPSVNTKEKIEMLIDAGMNVARLNFSHGTHEEHAKVIQFLKEARKEKGVPLAIMLDTKGPEIRIGKLKEEMLLEAKQRWHLVKEELIGDAARVTLKPSNVLDQLKEGVVLLFNDGLITSRVVEITEQGVVVEIVHGGKISSGKGVNIPNINLNLPAVTEKDIEDIRFGCEHDIDIIAASFIRSPEHVLEIRKLIEDEGKSDIMIIAKIENHEGVQQFESIVQVADGIMIARGDLGVELPLKTVPKLQKMMIRKCYLTGKPSVTATQMLESMIQSARPTRAEASDVANAIYDSTSAVMLSGETAVGKYPIETVKVMRDIITESEQDFDYRTFFNIHTPLTYHDVPSAVTFGTVKTCYNTNAKAIFVFTSKGSTARLISRLRPSMPIIAMTANKKCYNQMAFNWGVVPMLGKECDNVQEAFQQVSEFALKNGMVKEGDLVVLTAGSPFGVSGSTNMMIVESIGNVLVRGNKGFGIKVEGNVIFALTAEEKEVKDALIVLTRCDESYLSLMRQAAGIILQNHPDDTASEKYALQAARELGKSALVRADGALRNLQEGQRVILEPNRCLVFLVS
jgi:pyruvate kinase